MNKRPTERGLALHVGVNRVNPEHYRGWEGPLSSCENDADTLEEIARSRGFQTRQLKTEKATRDRVIGAIRAASGQLAAGDMFLLSYAGHGNRIRDIDGDEADGKDDTWCLFDGQLLDDELNVLFAGFAPGVRILVLSDSCHSGTMLKGGGPATASRKAQVEDDFVESRLMPRQASIEVGKAQRGFYARIQQALPRPRPRVRASVRLLSGCQEHEQSFGNRESGRFTAAVKTVYGGGAFSGDYAEFHQAIVAAVAQAMNPQTPNHTVSGASDPDYDRQAPFRLGATE